MTCYEKLQALAGTDENELSQVWAANVSGDPTDRGIYVDANSKPHVLKESEAQGRDDLVFLINLCDDEIPIRSERDYHEMVAYALRWMFDYVDQRADEIERAEAFAKA